MWIKVEYIQMKSFHKKEIDNIKNNNERIIINKNKHSINSEYSSISTTS
jgi:hypothetical protein